MKFVETQLYKMYNGLVQIRVIVLNDKGERIVGLGKPCEPSKVGVETDRLLAALQTTQEDVPYAPPMGTE